MLFAIFFSTIGISLFFTNLSGVYLYTDFFKSSCPSVNGRLCNGRGTCGEFGLCICEPLFDGDGCQDTQCPGYDEATGIVCNGRGLCSPFLTSEQIPLECREIAPTRLNNYVRSGGSWKSPECERLISERHDRFAEGDITGLQGIPTCACHAPYGSSACEHDLCPQNSEFNVCSGNGNKSVGIVRNDTITGNGCQCQNYVSLYDLVTLLTRDELAVVTGKYLNDFRKGFCGTVRRISGSGGTSVFFEQSPVDVKCFCDELYTGVTCQFGICPENNGIICSGHGNPNLGFGLDLGTTKYREGCTPICGGSSVFCRGRCTSASECNAPDEVCPLDRPWRCASGNCVKGDNPKCERMYEYGVWDDLSNIHSSVSCDYDSVVAQFSDRRRRRKSEACFGAGVAIANKNFIVPGVEFHLPSRMYSLDLLIVDDDSVNQSVVTVTYDGITQQRNASLRNRFQFIRTSSQVIEDRFTNTGLSVNIYRSSLGRLVVSPNPRFHYDSSIATTFRFRSSSDNIVGTYSHIEFTSSIDGDLFIILVNNQSLNYNGQIVSISTCVNVLTGCMWKVDTGKALTGGSIYACTNDGSSFTIQAEACNIPYSYIQGRYMSSMVLDTNDTWTLVNPTLQWNVDVATVATSLSSIFLTSTRPVVSIHYVLESDLRQACICPPYGTNKSSYHLDWLDESSTRPDAVTVGEYSVGRRTIGGVIFTVRGRVERSQPPRILEQTSGQLVDLVETGRRITSREFGQGTPDDDPEIYPARCVNGSSSSIELRYIEGVRRDCQCVISFSGLTCQCENPFGDKDTCIDEGCDPGWRTTLEEFCFWSQQLDIPIRNIGFRIIAPGEWTSLDVHSFPLEIQTSGACNASYVFDQPHTIECIDNKLVIYPEFTFIHQQQTKWTIFFNGSITARFYENYGGISVNGIPWNMTIYASSTLSGNVSNVASTSRETWKSKNDDHQAAIIYVFPQEVGFVSAFVDIVSAGINTDIGPIPVVLFIEASISQSHDSWVTLASFSTSAVINGTAYRRTIPLNNEDRVWRAIRLHSYFPMEVRTFTPFVDQNCSVGRLEGSAPMFESRIVQLMRDPPDISMDCICNDDCAIGSVVLGNNYRCEDELYINGTDDFICAAGTDCHDCGNNKRQFGSVNTSRICATDGERELITRFASLPDPSLNTVWRLDEFIAVGSATVTFNYTTDTGVAWKWVRPMCTDECPFATCKDGTCADTLALCPDILYNCPGNGCVRATVELNEYSCACDRGHGGIECELTTCTPGDPETGLVSPHEWCNCNGPSPLRIRPPYEIVLGSGFRAFRDSDILEVNRPSGRISQNDIGWVNIRAAKAPFGIPFLRIYDRGGTSYYTNCPYRARSILGIYLELEECVASRNHYAPHEVTEWKTLRDGQIIVWHNETHYDDAPYRCPAGHCVSQERECYTVKLRDPPCGNIRATCLVDGTCECPRGEETWVINQELTDKVVVPYRHVKNIMQTTVWGEEDDNRFVSLWCRARNCSEVDCSPPHGCFPGTPSLNFKDRLRECPGPTNKGMCALTIHECRTGVVSAPQYCSGNGELRKRDYREEWYCECGSTVDGIFKPNGYGGSRCQDYSCQDDPNIIYFARQQPYTLDEYLDINNLPLPGKWIGPCGATVGANPNDIAEWNQCCPGIVQLERCTTIPCIIGGVTRCVDIEECQGADRSPKVYVCNGQGVALADGTCKCTNNQNSGSGFTHDLDVYSTKGCFRQVECSAAKTTGTVCNRFPSCSEFQNWPDLPVIPFLWNQAYVYAAREGLPPTNESIVRKVMSDHLNDIVGQTYIQEALSLLSDRRAAETCICILSANDTCADPPGMLPCGDNMLVYRKSIPTPYNLVDVLTTEYSFLIDRLFASSITFSVGNLETQSVSLGGFSVTIGNGDQYYTIDAIRLHIVASALVTVSFVNEYTQPVCQPVTISANADYSWRDIYCIRQYTPARFDLLHPVEWRANCMNDEDAPLCTLWIRTTCLATPLGAIQETYTLEFFSGCGSSLCCIATTEPFSTARSMYIQFTSTIRIDEIVVFGHSDISPPVPQKLSDRLLALTGTTCVDERVFYEFGGQLSLFLADSNPSIWSDALNICKLEGGVLASYMRSVDISNGYARTAGEACYLNGARNVGGTGCYVNARDRNEIANPDTLSHLIQPSCSLYGCSQFKVTNTRSYHSDPFGGIGWADAWRPNQITLRAQMIKIAQKRNAQYSSQVYRGPMYMELLSSPTVKQNDYSSFMYPALGIDWWETGVSTPEPTYSATPGIVEDDSIDFWSNDHTCDITFFSVPNCGFWIQQSQYDTLNNGDLDRVGAYFTLHIRPDNYLYYFNHANLLDLNLVFTEPVTSDWGMRKVTLGGVVGSVVSAVHHLAIGDSIRYTRSWSIRGNCGMKMSGGYGAHTYTNVQVEPHLRAGSAANFWNMGQDIVGSPQGCFPQLYPLSRTVSSPCPPIQDYQVNQWDKITNGYDNIGPIGPGSDGSMCDTVNRRNPGLTVLTVFPIFENYAIRFFPMAPPYEYYPNTDVFEMGYMNSAYMCTAVRAVVNAVIRHGETPIETAIDPNIGIRNVFPDGAARYMIDLPGGLFVHNPNVCHANPGQYCDLNYTAFPLCDATSTRHVRECSDCILRPLGDFAFYQEALDTSNLEFVTSLDVMKQDSVDGGPLIYQKMIVNWVDHLSVQHEDALDTLIGTRAYSRMISRLRPADYGTLVNIEACVEVLRFSTANSYDEYQFYPVACRQLLYAVCIQDTDKFAVALGTQCDVCGPSCRIPTVQPNATVYTLFPSLDPELDPLGQEILQAYLDGTLDELISATDLIPWDKVILQLQNVSILHAFPEAMDDLRNQISTRPRHLSPGQSADPERWRNMALAKLFPYDCGFVTNPQTGKEKRLCAISHGYCDYEFHFDGPPMAEEDIPTIFSQTQTASTTNTLCTVPVLPQEFHIYTNEGEPQPSNDDFEVVKYDQTHIELRVLVSNATWANTGRRLVAPLGLNFTLTGQIFGSVAVGRYRIWVGIRSPVFQLPEIIEYVMDWHMLATETSVLRRFEVTYSPISSNLAVLGIDFENLQEGSTITLGTILVSNVNTLAFCQAIPKIKWVEIPSVIESFAPYHTCDFDAGMCYCAPDSPYGGPTCEWPSITIPENGKQICSGFGEDGGMALERGLGLTNVIESGVFFDTSVERYDCKCENVGLMIETIMRPSSAFDFAYVLRKDKDPNADEFVIVTPPEDIAIPVKAQDITEVCASITASLPSWNTGDEATRFVEMNTLDVFVDIQYENDEFIWKQRDQVFNYDNHTTTAVSGPCPYANPDMCAALNWNNLAFHSVVSSSTQFVDGAEATFTFSATFYITLATAVDNIKVEVYVAGSQAGATLEADSRPCTMTHVYSNWVEFECLFSGITELEFSDTDPGATRTYQEVRVFRYQDTRRIPGYFL